MRRTRGRRGGRGSNGPLDNLPSAAEMVLPSDYSDAFRLAVLLAHKLLNKDEWDEAGNLRRPACENHVLLTAFIQSGATLHNEHPFLAICSIPSRKTKEKEIKKESGQQSCLHRSNGD